MDDLVAEDAAKWKAYKVKREGGRNQMYDGMAMCERGRLMCWTRGVREGECCWDGMERGDWAGKIVWNSLDFSFEVLYSEQPIA